MHRPIYCVFILIALLLTSLSGLAYDEEPFEYPEDDSASLNTQETSSALSTTTKTTATTTPSSVDLVIEEVVENATESVINNATEVVFSFLTEYSLNVNRSLSADLTFTSYLNHTILALIQNEHELHLINANDGTIVKSFQYANILATQHSESLVIYDDNTQELWILNATTQLHTPISFKPKKISVFPLKPNVWIAETSEELYLSENSGLNWRKIDDSSNSLVLGWSNNANAAILRQHSHYIKLLNLQTYAITSVLADVLSATLFSRYLLTKQSNRNDSFSISHVNNLDNQGFRSLSQRFPSEGKFYCAIEDETTKTLLLLFTTDEKSGENNETIPSTCSLVSYSKRNAFSLTNISCENIANEKSLQCTKKQLPLYQVGGLGKSVYLVNVGVQPRTLISYDGGLRWNKTFYQCDPTMQCANNFSVVIGSLQSSSGAPGVVVGKVSNGINEYLAVSADGGRSWQINASRNDSLIAISNPSALLVTVAEDTQQTLSHSLHYSTDYGRYWYERTFLNQTSFQILSLLADKNNIFHFLILNNENQFALIQVNFSLLINQQCARYQIKEWSSPIGCTNGSKLFYQRRAPASHCLNSLSEIRTEPCTCTLADFQCLPGYRRSSDGLCLPKSQYTSTQDCTCSENNTYATKTRGYVKSEGSQCVQGVENYLSNVYLARRESNHPNVLLYGMNSFTKQPFVEIYTHDFDQRDEEDDEEEEGQSRQNTIWLVHQSYEITALAFNDSGKQVYMAVDHDQTSTIYRTSKNLREQNRLTKQLSFETSTELYKSFDERIEYLTMDWSTENLYVLARNKQDSQQTIFILNTRTHKRRTIVRNQRIQPSTFILDPVKSELYWISSSVLNIANLQGEIKKQYQFPLANSSISYFAHDPITHEILYVLDSTIFALNTLDQSRLHPRVIYENAFPIENALFIPPVVYFTRQNNQTNPPTVSLNTIDILARSFAKDLTKLREFDQIKLFIDMSPPRPTTTIGNRCTANPCSEICIPLENERFRCLCADDAPYPSCSCPKDEQYVAGSCQARNGQCAAGRTLCQNQINCAESARVCEQDHTQYTESFKTTSRCTIEQANDGFDCYYAVNGMNRTCIPYEWFCDGTPDCPLGNDEEHCQKLTTTVRTAVQTPRKCLIGKQYTHAMCASKCLRIDKICENVTNQYSCMEQFHLHCKQTHNRNQYECKCMDKQNRCYPMTEQCDDYDHCEKICQASIHLATQKTFFNRPSSITWIVLILAILAILVVTIIIMTLRYRRQRRNTPANTRTPAVVAETTDSPSTNTREKLLNNEVINNSATH